MKKSVLEMYALAICFVTLICFVIALGIGIYNMIRIVNPEFTLSAYEHERHQSNRAFRGFSGIELRMELRGLAPARPAEISEPSDEELTRQREQSYQNVMRAEQRRGTQSLTMVGIVIFIDLMVFAVHWLLARKARISMEPI